MQKCRSLKVHIHIVDIITCINTLLDIYILYIYIYISLLLLISILLLLYI